MNNQKTRPSGWYYGLAALVLVLGCLITMVVVYRWFPGLPGTFESRDGEGLRSTPPLTPSKPVPRATSAVDSGLRAAGRVM